MANNMISNISQFLLSKTGECCTGGPTRLCNCLIAPGKYSKPKLIDLLENPHEDMEDKLDYEGNETLKAIVQNAREIMINTYKSVFEDRGVPPPEGAEETPSLYFNRLRQLPENS